MQGLVHYEQGDAATAVSLYNKALLIFSELEGAESQWCADVGYNLALAYEEQALAAAYV